MFGHGPVCIYIAFWLYIGCLLVAIFVKYTFYVIVGKVYGMRPFNTIEDFWLCDLPINPTSIPAIFTFNKTDQDARVYLDKLLKTIKDRNINCNMKLQKKFGKYYLKQLNDEEHMEWRRTNTGIRDDITNDDEAMEFMKKLKKIPGKVIGKNTFYIYFVPSMNNGTESGIISCAHHTHADGFSAMQACFEWSDDPMNSEYPFMKRASPSIFQWLLVYMTFPVGFIQMWNYYRSRKPDINCIKKHE